jgi:hypothetical protein
MSPEGLCPLHCSYACEFLFLKKYGSGSELIIHLRCCYRQLGQEVVFPIEVNLGAYRLAKQNNLDVKSYYALMMDNIDEVTDKRVEALEEIEKNKENGWSIQQEGKSQIFSCG